MSELHVIKYRRHTAAVRVMHWINVVTLTILLMSGLQIFNAHPILNWGQQSYDGSPPFFQLQHGFPGWATLPGMRWLSMGRNWHFFFAWILVINGLTYIVYSIASRHLRRDLAPTRMDLKTIWQSIKDHARFKHASGEEARNYNVLQKLTYLIVIFGLVPFIVLMGLAMSPRINAVWPGWVDLVGGRQSARTLHFLGAVALVLFVLVHVFEVIITGFWNNLRSMITGKFVIEVPRKQAVVEVAETIEAVEAPAQETKS
jgi:thiosulfate reductase cytochrome b subunit